MAFHHQLCMCWDAIMFGSVLVERLWFPSLWKRGDKWPMHRDSSGHMSALCRTDRNCIVQKAFPLPGGNVQDLTVPFFVIVGSWQRPVYQMTRRERGGLIPGTREFRTRTSNRIPFYPWGWNHPILSCNLQPGISPSTDSASYYGIELSLLIPRTLKCCTEDVLMHL